MPPVNQSSKPNNNLYPPWLYIKAHTPIPSTTTHMLTGLMGGTELVVVQTAEKTCFCLCIIKMDARLWAKITNSFYFGTDISEYQWKLEGKGKTGGKNKGDE